ncbi:MAG: malto-oligosyltrehalose trehalohydrolase, partial [Candidatus Omnitrophica bacterium]|nr:malto-oligosyltrehalose trehalohydrolase [Candidatus Omnitrophota bacterium]
PLGAQFLPGKGVSFEVWAPKADKVEVRLARRNRKITRALKKMSGGSFELLIPEARVGDRYTFRLNGDAEFPDPASRFQPLGVHGPSQVVDPGSWRWSDTSWKGVWLRDCVFYEMHVGTFTSEGTFEAAVKRLSHLARLGVGCVEVMPVAEFPGKRNWGYDGVSLYAVQSSYGGPEGLARFVDTCHRLGMGVCLDVVYNHFGPEGNYWNSFGPYINHAIKTPWGGALNYDSRGSGGVRRHVVENAMYWLDCFHVDALRLDAVHAIVDRSSCHIVREIKEAALKLSARTARQTQIIAEINTNDPRVVASRGRGCFRADAQWSDDFHHALHTELTGESGGYYADYQGLRDLARSSKRAYVYAGEYSPFRKARYGGSVDHEPAEKFVIANQNHDQIGNRAWGERLISMINASQARGAAALLLTLPYTPMLFMGEEWGETAPFRYFVHHGDPGLVAAVRKGRFEEFKEFGWKKIPDPQSPATFAASRIRWKRAGTERGRRWMRLYRDLIRLRRSPALRSMDKRRMTVNTHEKGPRRLEIQWKISNTANGWAVFSFDPKAGDVPMPFEDRRARILLSSESARYGGKRRKPIRAIDGSIRLLPHEGVIVIQGGPGSV